MLNFAFIDDENKRGRPRLGGCPRLEGVLRHICPRLTPFTHSHKHTQTHTHNTSNLILTESIVGYVY